MGSRNNLILSEILGMSEEQLATFTGQLKPDTLEYLDILLEKAHRDPIKLKKYLKATE